MIFTKADRDLLERTRADLLGLRSDVGMRNGEESLRALVKQNAAFLNELGAAVGRIEAEQKNTFPKFLFLDGRISELIDNIKSRADMANNAIVALSGRLSGIEKREGLKARSKL